MITNNNDSTSFFFITKQKKILFSLRKKDFKFFFKVQNE